MLTVWPWVPDVLAEWVTLIRPLCGPVGNPALWPTERAPRISVHQVDHRFAAYRAARAGLDFHSLRRSYVTHLIEDGWDPLFARDRPATGTPPPPRSTRVLRLPNPVPAPGAGCHDERRARPAGGAW